MLANIQKLYISNFLIGLVFWYGIEKLFMQSIGIDAVGVGIASAVFLGFNLIFDIPSGVLADKWSRKGMLMVAAVALALSSVMLGNSHGLALYLVGYVLYGVYVVCTSGTYQAIMYDTLHQLGRSREYSKINGRAYALFLGGAGVANVLSGFVANSWSYRATFYLTLIPCVLNLIVIARMTEPTFHKAEHKEKILFQVSDATKAIAKVQLLRVLTVVISCLTIVELFKDEFGQLYMLHYFSQPEVIGLLWAAFAFTWSLGSLIAHRFQARLNLLVVASVLPLVAMSFIDNWFSLVLFMVQSVAGAALQNQIETRIQDATPSAVRATILSVLSSIGRAISIPASFGLGWVIRQHDALWALRSVTLIGVFVLFYWLWTNRENRLLTSNT